MEMSPAELQHRFSLSKDQLDVVLDIYDIYKPRCPKLTAVFVIRFIKIYGVDISHRSIGKCIANQELFTKISGISSLKFTVAMDAITHFRKLVSENANVFLLFFVEVDMFIIADASDYLNFARRCIDDDSETSFYQYVIGAQPQKLVFFTHDCHTSAIQEVVKKDFGCETTLRDGTNHKIVTVENICKDYDDTYKLYLLIRERLSRNMADGVWMKPLTSMYGENMVDHLIDIVKDLSDEMSVLKTGIYNGPIKMKFITNNVTVHGNVNGNIIGAVAGDSVANATVVAKSQLTPHAKKTGEISEWMIAHPPIKGELKSEYRAKTVAAKGEINDVVFGAALEKSKYWKSKWKRNLCTDGKRAMVYDP